jgi:3-phosphoshikimate 1-carboxyvinyltransferase
MRKSVKYSTIDGIIAAPASKSVVQRVIAAALLADGTSHFDNVTLCDDSQAAISIARALGAKIELTGRHLKVTGGFNPQQQTLNCGESGLSSRMFAAIAALSFRELILTGQPALRKRPADMIPEPLIQLGAHCVADNGHLPLKISGPLKGGKVNIDGSLSSQFLTGLLMALPIIPTDSEITVANLKSKPYIDLTLEILGKFGIRIEHQDYRRFFVPGGQKYQPVDMNVEGDFSGAAFLLVAGALRGRVTVTGLNPDSRQADRAILELLKQAGAQIEINSNAVHVARSDLQAFACNATHFPDLFPPLVALAVGCQGISRIDGAGRLLYKESNRAVVLKTEFGKLGIDIQIEGDTMLIPGGQIQGGRTEAHNDHRIAMALAVAGLNAEQPVIIDGVECVAKSYPAFFDDLISVGGNIDE